MPLIAELPAPAEPAGGGNCAKRAARHDRLTSTAKRTSAEWPDIGSPGKLLAEPNNVYVGRAFPELKLAPVFSRSRHL